MSASQTDLEVQAAAQEDTRYRQITQMIHAAITKIFGQNYVSGKWLGPSVTLAQPAVGAPLPKAPVNAGVVGVVYPDNDTITITADGEIAVNPDAIFPGGAGFPCGTTTPTPGDGSADKALTVQPAFGGGTSYALQYALGSDLPLGASPRTFETFITFAKPDGHIGGGGTIISYGPDLDSHGVQLYNENMHWQIYWGGGAAGIVILSTFWTDFTQTVEWVGLVWPSPALWYHVAVVYDGGTAWTLYINGAAVSTLTIGRPLNTQVVSSVAVPALATDGVIIGGVNYAPSQNLDASLDELAIYTAALSATQIAAHYSHTTVVDYMNAVLGDNPTYYYRMDGMIGPLARDWSVWAHHATVLPGAWSFNTDGPLTGDSPPVTPPPAGSVPVSDGGCGITWQPLSAVPDSVLTARADGGILVGRGTGNLVSARSTFP